MEQIATELIKASNGLPVALIYVVASLWIGLECAGVGLPVEPIMLFLGSLAAADNHGKVNAWLAILVTSLVCILFGIFSYAVGRRYGSKFVNRFGRFVGLKPARADHIELWLRHHGAVGVTVIRAVPLARTWCSIISGIADVAVPGFALGTFVGSAIYCAIWIILGDILGANYQVALKYFDRFGLAGIAIAVGIIIAIIVLHWLLGRLAYFHLARHFHLHHHAQHAQSVPNTPTSSVADA